MNPVFYNIIGVIVYFLCIITITLSLCFFMGIFASTTNFNARERLLCFFCGLVFAALTILGYDCAEKLINPDSERIYQRVMEEKPTCDIKSLACIKKMAKWLKDSSDAYTVYRIDSIDAINTYNKAVKHE